MSLIVYEVLTAQPDFTDAPTYGIDDDRDTVNSPGGTSFAAWTGTTDKTLRFDFQTISAEEWRNLREFIDRAAGRAGAFFLPSWQHDFELAADAAPGDTVIQLTGHWFGENMTENRPDTLGRVLFTVNHVGAFEILEVTATGETGTNDLVFLSRPIANGMEAGRTVVGFCYLARLVTDNVESQHLSPDHARTTLGFRAITQTRRLTQTETAEGPDIGSLHGNVDIEAMDADPLFSDTRVVESIGPQAYGAAQSENFDAAWIARVVGNAVEVVPPSGAPFLSTLYDGAAPPRHVSLAFDAASREVLAWDLENGTSRVAWRDGGGSIVRTTFTGISPVLFNTFTIDSTVDAGTATTAVYYLKPADATIYCRIYAEDFAGEYRYCISPLAPLRLYRVRAFQNRVEIVGIDAGHRRARWRSTPYVPPLERQKAFGTAEGISGEYRELRVFTSMQESGTGTGDATVVGEYRAIRVYFDAGSFGSGTGTGETSMAGAYTEVRTYRDAGTIGHGTGTGETAMAGEYKLVRKLAEVAASGRGIGQTEITGTYAP